MKRYSYIHSLYYAFYSKSFYQDVARNWKGLCFSYLLFILCLLWIPGISRIQSEVSEFLSDEAPKYVKQVPVITISKGNVSIKEQVPYFINVPEKNTPFAIIDPSGQITSLDKTSALVLLTRSQLIIKNSSAQSRAFDLKEIDHLTIDQKVIYGWLETFNTLFPVILPFCPALFISLSCYTGSPERWNRLPFCKKVSVRSHLQSIDTSLCCFIHPCNHASDFPCSIRHTISLPCADIFPDLSRIPLLRRGFEL